MSQRIISYKIEDMLDNRAKVVFVKFFEANNTRRPQCVVASVEESSFSGLDDVLHESLRVGVPFPEQAFNALVATKVYKRNT